MSNGVETLLQAAQYIEQQEQLKLSPTNNEQHQQRLPLGSYDTLSAPSMNGVTTTATATATSVNNHSSINTRNSNGRHPYQQQQHNHQHSHQPQQQQYHVSSSAPAAAATFQHTNGLTITATSAALANGSATGSQLITATTNHHRRNGGSGMDFEFSGNGSFAGSLGSGVTIIATAAAAAAAAGGSSSNSSLSPASSPIAAATSSNGRSSEGRMSEDEFSSPSPPISQNKSPAFLLLAASKQNKTDEQEQNHEQQQQSHQHNLQQQQQQQQQHNENNLKLKSFTLVDGGNNSAARNVAGVVASKQMLLSGGVRIAAPAATVASNAIDVAPTSTPATTTATSPKMISILQRQEMCANKMFATSSPSTFSLHGSMSRHKSGVTLTPPPSASRKLSSEPYLPRIRSYSMNSHKLSALLHNGGNSNSSTSNSSSQMLVDDIAPHLGGGNHSPPRHGGSHYMNIMSGSQGAAHPHIAHCGRRRTISSNSNGAGTREVHNILEKNRRAHLKGCYDELKNELSLNDEERSKKTSNLAVLNEASKIVKNLQVQEKDDETEMEQLAKEKIILQKKIVILKRELGPKCEQFFLDSDLGSIPSERDNGHDSASLSSGRGSTLYSSSSSLSSGGSSNIMFSPVGAGLTTATPTAISPVITKLNNNNNNSNHNNNTTAGITNLQQQHNNNNHSNSNSISNNTTAHAAATTTVISLTDSPTSGLPLITRGSPTPSTPSPSPSSSSGVSSSCSLISSSPPMSGVISSGRSVTVNIPFHQANSGGATIGTIGNGTASAAATIIATSPPNGAGSNAVKNNNAAAHSNQMVATSLGSSSHSNHNNHNNSCNINGYRRKTSLSISDDGKATLTTTTIKDYEDAAQQPAAKCIKVFNGLVAKENIAGPKQSAAASAPASLQLSQVVGGGSLVVSPSFFGAVTNAGATLRTQKILMNGVGQNGGPNGAGVKNIILNGTATATNELGRLPGGAELNILPSNGAKLSGISAAAATTAASSAPTAFYHANGKLTLVNGGAAVGVGGNSGILLKDTSNALGGSSAASITPIIVSTTQNSPSTVGGVTSSGLGGINASTNFAQLLAASSVAPHSLATVKTVAPVERLNGKLRLSIGVGQERPQINAQPHIGNNMMKPMIVTMTTTTAAAPPPPPPPPTTQQQLGTATVATISNMNTGGNSAGAAAFLYGNEMRHKATTRMQQQQQHQQHMPAMPMRSQLQQKLNTRFQQQHQPQNHLQQSTIPMFKTKRTAPPITPTTTTTFLTTAKNLSSNRR